MSYNCERLFFLFWNGLVTKTMELSLRVSLEMNSILFLFSIIIEIFTKRVKKQISNHLEADKKNE